MRQWSGIIGARSRREKRIRQHQIERLIGMAIDRPVRSWPDLACTLVQRRPKPDDRMGTKGRTGLCIWQGARLSRSRSHHLTITAARGFESAAPRRLPSQH